MSKFYGKMWDRVGRMSTRCGHSQLVTQAGSHQGGVQVILTEIEGVIVAEVSLIAWLGNGTRQILYNGPVNPVRVAIGQSNAMKAALKAVKTLSPQDMVHGQKLCGVKDILIKINKNSY